MLMVAATTLGILHMTAPDHWAPVTALSLRRRYRNQFIAGIALVIGTLHGLSSLTLSLLVLLIGMRFIPFHYINTASIVLLILVSIYILLSALHEHDGSVNESFSLTAVVTVSSLPDPALIPIVLSVLTYGSLYTLLAGAAYTLASMSSVTLVVLLINRGLLRTLSTVNPRYMDYAAAATLLLTALYIYLNPNC
ncbi:MAG: hypothetical protein RXQ00_09070 [Caldivirga sp.]